jgi:hypothetical protein
MLGISQNPEDFGLSEKKSLKKKWLLIFIWWEK